MTRAADVIAMTLPCMDNCDDASDEPEREIAAGYSYVSVGPGRVLRRDQNRYARHSAPWPDISLGPWQAIAGAETRQDDRRCCEPTHRAVGLSPIVSLNASDIFTKQITFRTFERPVPARDSARLVGKEILPRQNVCLFPVERFWYRHVSRKDVCFGSGPFGVKRARRRVSVPVRECNGGAAALGRPGPD